MAICAVVAAVCSLLAALIPVIMQLLAEAEDSGELARAAEESYDLANSSQLTEAERLRAMAALQAQAPAEMARVLHNEEGETLTVDKLQATLKNTDGTARTAAPPEADDQQKRVFDNTKAVYMAMNGISLDDPDKEGKFQQLVQDKPEAWTEFVDKTIAEYAKITGGEVSPPGFDPDPETEGVPRPAYADYVEQVAKTPAGAKALTEAGLGVDATTAAKADVLFTAGLVSLERKPNEALNDYVTRASQTERGKLALEKASDSTTEARIKALVNAGVLERSDEVLKAASGADRTAIQKELLTDCFENKALWGDRARLLGIPENQIEAETFSERVSSMRSDRGSAGMTTLWHQLSSRDLGHYVPETEAETKLWSQLREMRVSPQVFFGMVHEVEQARQEAEYKRKA